MYEYTIGLEIHIKLNSQNKLFCKCENKQEFNELEPNTHVCPYCTAQPGALPVLNKEPLEKAVLLGYALNCNINKYSSFDRKSYFYPDSPAGYQITQLREPTNGEGYVEFFTNNYTEYNKVRIERAHIENDAGKTIHEGSKAIMDYNRAGTPLVEIVTYPDFTSDEQVVEFLKELQRLVRFNNIGYADMEKGQLRCDVNISVNQKGSNEFGTKVELKNINSFGAISRAINNEFERQVDIIESGNEVEQQTRGWDDTSGSSFLLRSKEDALDYRYFPEPDLPPIYIDKDFLQNIEEQKVESSYSRIKRYNEEYGFNKEYINALIQTPQVNDLFEYTVKNGIKPSESAKFISLYILRYMNDNNIDVNGLKFGYDDFVKLLSMLQNGDITDSHAKQVIKFMLDEGKDPETIVEEQGLKPIDQGEIEKIVNQVIEENPKAFEDYKGGNEKSVGFLVGQVMQKSGGKADPKVARSIIQDIANNK